MWPLVCALLDELDDEELAEDLLLDELVLELEPEEDFPFDELLLEDASELEETVPLEVVVEDWSPFELEARGLELDEEVVSEEDVPPLLELDGPLPPGDSDGAPPHADTISTRMTPVIKHLRTRFISTFLASCCAPF